jgi:hypothetical protein
MIYSRKPPLVDVEALVAAACTAPDPLTGLKGAIEKLDKSFVSYCAQQYVGLMHRFKAVAKEIGDSKVESSEAETVRERVMQMHSNNELLRDRLLRACQVCSHHVWIMRLYG